MIQKNSKGLHLRRDAVRQSTGAGCVVPAASAGVSGMVWLLCVADLTGFGSLCSPLGMLAGCAAVCSLLGLACYFRKQRYAYGGILGVLVLMALLLGKRIASGIGSAWNQLTDVWLAGTRWALPQLEVQPEAGAALFAVFLGMAAAQVCCALSEKAPSVLAVLTVFSVCVLSLLLRGDTRWALVMLLTSLFLLLNGTVSGGGSWDGKALLGNLLLPVLLCVLVLPLALIPSVQARSGAVSEGFLQKLHERRYEREDAALPEGDFSGFRERREDPVPGLIVTMDHPETLYLRGFTGAVFENGKWLPLDAQALAENRDLLLWLNRNAFDPKAQFLRAVAPETVFSNSVSIQNAGACSRYLYVPFNLGDNGFLEEQHLDPDSVDGKGLRTYAFESLLIQEDTLAQTLEYLRGSDSADVQRYRMAESAYREFVNEKYLQVSEDVRELLGGYWDEAASRYGEPGAVTGQLAQAAAADFLSACFPEDGKEGKVPLLLPELKGSSYQYATVAAMTLRHFGIPARYAEGYVVTKELASTVESGEGIQVDSSCAGAWVEVYHDGIGWIPMDMTPGMEELAKGWNTSLDPKKEAEEEEEEPEETQEPEREETDDGTAVTLPQILLRRSLLFLLILLLLAALAVLRHKWILERRTKRFRSESRNDAVAWIFADCALLLEKMGFHRGNGSMYALTEAIRQGCGEEYARLFVEMTALNSRAMFSSRELEQSHWEAAMAFRQQTLAQLTGGQAWYRKLWMQWILCLY